MSGQRRRAEGVRNLCRHRAPSCARGIRLVPQSDPLLYHSWSYAWTGACSAAPNLHDMPDLVQSGLYGLHPGSAEQWLVYLWLNLDPQAPRCRPVGAASSSARLGGGCSNATDRVLGVAATTITRSRHGFHRNYGGVIENTSMEGAFTRVRRHKRAPPRAHRRACPSSDPGPARSATGWRRRILRRARRRVLALVASRRPNLPGLARATTGCSTHRAAAQPSCRPGARPRRGCTGSKPLTPDTPESSSTWLFDRGLHGRQTASTLLNAVDLLDLTNRLGLRACERWSSACARPPTPASCTAEHDHSRLSTPYYLADVAPDTFRARLMARCYPRRLPRTSPGGGKSGADPSQ